MEGDDPGGEQLDVGMLLGIAQQLPALGGDRNARTPAVRRIGPVSAEPCLDQCVPGGHAQVIGSLGRHGRNDIAKTVGHVLPRNTTGPVAGFLEDPVAPDVLGERPGVVDVLEPLADVVPEPLADGLRRVPAMDELGACESQLFTGRHRVSPGSGSPRRLGTR